MRLSHNAAAGLCWLVAACTGRTGPTEEHSVYGLHIDAFDRIPATEVAAMVEPAANTPPLVQPTSQLIVDALRSCEHIVNTPGAIDTIVTMQFAVIGGRIAKRAVRGEASAARECLEQALIGKQLAPLGNAPHSLTLQLRRGMRDS